MVIEWCIALFNSDQAFSFAKIFKYAKVSFVEPRGAQRV